MTCLSVNQFQLYYSLHFPQLAWGEVLAACVMFYFSCLNDLTQGCVIRRICLTRRIVLNAYFTVLNVSNDRMTHPWFCH